MLRRFQKDPLKYALDLASFSILWNVILTFAVVLTWNSYGNIPDDNHISVGLTTIEIFLVVVALSGFWMLRTIVAETAYEQASIAAYEAVKEMDPQIRRQVEQLVKEELEEQKRNNNIVSQKNGEAGYDLAKAMSEDETE
ncbi:hypothetical protein [Celeribacter naphthalenivorans]|uniref:hypothetical protein n=1 Tax=Celeribacter naphthalenivorans TaxID=1614694 RepID=UPI001CFA9418|nr:hypothetical protein [Celeribacter naphthalenivorans]